MVDPFGVNEDNPYEKNPFPTLRTAPLNCHRIVFTQSHILLCSKIHQGYYSIYDDMLFVDSLSRPPSSSHKYIIYTTTLHLSSFLLYFAQSQYKIPGISTFNFPFYLTRYHPTILMPQFFLPLILHSTILTGWLLGWLVHINNKRTERKSVKSSFD